MREIKCGRIYRHFKGSDYRVLCIATHTETGEKMVIYQRARDVCSIGTRIFARPYDMFASKVDKEKYPDVAQEYRFEEI